MVRAISNQSVFDLAVQTSGSAESAFAFALRNGLSVTDTLTPGQQLTTVDIMNIDIANYYNARNLKPATDYTVSEPQPEPGLEGIDYWAIEIDFVVS